MTAADVLARFPGARRNGSGWQARCPAHDDRTASLAIKEGRDGRVLVKCHAGCTTESVIGAAGLGMRDLFPDDGAASRNGSGMQVAATYDYTSADGSTVYQVVRYTPKDFRPRRPDGQGAWIYNLGGVERVPYCLPDLVNAIQRGRSICFTEGEKDAESLRSLKLHATTTGSATSWKPHFAKWFAGAKVVILPDNDPPGEVYARAVARDLIPVAARVAIIRLPGLPPRGDVTDWLGSGGDKAQIRELVRSTSALTLEALDALPPVPAAPPAAMPVAPEPEETWAPIRRRPRPLGVAAYHGLVGDFLRAVSPHTEADPAALLAQFLVCFGNAIPRKPHYFIEQARHYTNEFVLLAGETGQSRKGTSLNWCKSVMRVADEEWAKSKVVGGLSSGEGLIHNVRDPMELPRKSKDGSPQTDPGVTDKRLMVVESEFASVLKVMERTGNTLSETLRHAWETGDLRTMTKGSPEHATGAHISVVAHITPYELKKLLRDVDAENGLVNRFMVFSVSRSKYLPRGGRVPPQVLQHLGERVGRALNRAQGIAEVRLDAEAGTLWDDTYPSLTDQPPGLMGSMTAPRAAPHVLRVAMLYALMDGSDLIQTPHLLAALEVWRYSTDSVRFIFGDSLGHPVADKLLVALEPAGAAGLTMTEMHAALGRNAPPGEIRAAVQMLYSLGRIVQVESTSTGGRTPERWALRSEVYELNEESPPETPGEGLLSFNSYPSRPELALESRSVDTPGDAPDSPISAQPLRQDDREMEAQLRDVVRGRPDLDRDGLLRSVPFSRQRQAGPILDGILAEQATATVGAM